MRLVILSLYPDNREQEGEVGPPTASADTMMTMQGSLAEILPVVA